ncbi:MAG: DUF2723 domain-containing protein [Candidatus Eisenbacteria bacterium]
MKNWLLRGMRDPFWWGAVAVFTVVQTVYLLTMTLSCPFWDSGEFIATSNVLGIPHPPGTPLYVLIGRVFALIPFGQIAARVNFLSAFSSALTALFSYLIIVNLARRRVRRPGEAGGSPRPRDASERRPGDAGPAPRRPEDSIDRWIALAGGVAGAFFIAFSRTFWENATEAEVYGLSSLVMVFCVWLILKWDASGAGGQRNNNYLLLIGYLLFAAIGIHMGSMLVAPALLLYVLLIAPQTVFNREFIPTFLAALGAALLFVAMRAAGFSVLLAMLAVVIGFGALVASRWGRLGRRNLAFWLIALAVLGLTAQLFLIIRARLDPPINEADPNNWESLWLVLSRDQYKPPNPFLKRQATWAVQFSQHFYRYWKDQFDLGLRPEWFSMFVPFAIGGIGAVSQALRDRRRFLLTAALVFFTSVFLVFYLNFKEDEVRDRDYFFVAGYHFFGLWIGLGVATIARWLRGEPQFVEGEWRQPPGGRLFGLGAAGVLVALSCLPLSHGWYRHDRTDFLVARDYAYNMLVPLEPNAIIFTNGDNDTFPLWYIQEVEGVRKDVRVVNLSLLNTHWYIRQVRDYAPRVRISFTESEIDRLQGVMLPDGKIVYVKDILVHDILAENPDRPIYLAVTVPDEMGLEKNLVMEGLVFRIVPEQGEAERCDVATTWRNLREVFLYRGLLDAQGYFDPNVYKDDNARKLIQNYVAAYVRLAHAHLRKNEEARALEALEYAQRINPAFPGVLYTLGYLRLEREEYSGAEEAFRELLAAGDRSPETYRLLAASIEAQGRLGDAETVYRDAVRRYPDDFDLTRMLFTYLWSQDKREAGIEVIQGWLNRHPNDTVTRQALDELLRPEGADSQAAPRIPAIRGAR